MERVGIRPPHEGGIDIRESEPRPFENTIVALDVDGVLVKPLAYRQAVSETISFFREQLEVSSDKFMLDDRMKDYGRNMSNFEALGIHDPWDVSAIIVSLMILNKTGVEVSNEEALRAYSERANPQSHPPEVIREWIIENYGEVEVGVMEHINRVLSDTRDPFKNDVTSVFQEYVLGKEDFEAAYGKESQTGAEKSLIRTQDRSLITPSGRKEVEEISRNGGMVVIYTGRPGLPPPDIERETADGYAPEAELAVKISKLDTTVIGIVSMGSMEWLARTTGSLVEDLTKPNATHALATILAGLRGRVDSEVLMDAYRWGMEGKLPEEMLPFIEKKLNLVVVEDTPSGVNAFIKARKILEDAGVKVGLTAIGVHDGEFGKHEAFIKLARNNPGVDVIDTNTAIGEGIRRYFFETRVQHGLTQDLEQAN